MQRTDHVPDSAAGTGQTPTDDRPTGDRETRDDTAARTATTYGSDPEGRSEPLVTKPVGTDPSESSDAGETSRSDTGTVIASVPAPEPATDQDKVKDQEMVTDTDADEIPDTAPADRTGDTVAGRTGDTVGDTVSERRTPSHSEHVLEPSVSAKYQERWREVQATFVDDPAGAVHSADELVMEVTSALSTAVSKRREKLGTHPATSTDGETEELRTTLRSYREIVQRLLEV